MLIWKTRITANKRQLLAQSPQTHTALPHTKHLNNWNIGSSGNQLMSPLVQNHPYTHYILFLFCSVVDTCSHLAQRCCLEAVCTTIYSHACTL